MLASVNANINEFNGLVNSYEGLRSEANSIVNNLNKLSDKIQAGFNVKGAGGPGPVEVEAMIGEAMAFGDMNQLASDLDEWLDLNVKLVKTLASQAVLRGQMHSIRFSIRVSKVMFALPVKLPEMPTSIIANLNWDPPEVLLAWWEVMEKLGFPDKPPTN